MPVIWRDKSIIWRWLVLHSNHCQWKRDISIILIVVVLFCHIYPNILYLLVFYFTQMLPLRPSELAGGKNFVRSCNLLLTLETSRSSYSQMFFKIGVFKNFQIFAVKQLCWRLFLMKLQTFRPLLKRYSSTGVFLWILRNS